MTHGGAKSNLTKWNLIGGIQFKHVKNTRICLFFFYYYFFNKSKRIALVSNLSVASNNDYTTNLENHEIHSVLGYIPKVS